jgi:hypothetical protein
LVQLEDDCRGDKKIKENIMSGVHKSVVKEENKKK